MKLFTFLFLLALPLMALSQVSSYTYSASQSPYTIYTGGSVLGTGSNNDRAFNNIPIGFTFRYNGSFFQSVSVNSNGFIAFGTSVSPRGAGYAYLSTSDRSGVALASVAHRNDLVAGFNMDLEGRPTSQITAHTEGQSPNRIFVVQWRNFRLAGSSTDTVNFQIQLHETSNRVGVHFGKFRYTTTRPYTPQVGLRGESNADFNNRSGASWSASSPGATNMASMEISPSSQPQEGLLYEWQPLNAPVDVAALKALAPPANGCKLTSTERIRAIIKNQGTGSLNSIQASYRVNNGPFISETIALNPGLSPGERDTVVFSQGYDFSASGRYAVTVVITDPSELPSTRRNDTAATSVMSGSTIDQFPYLEPFNSATQVPEGWQIEHLAGLGDWELRGPSIKLGSPNGDSIQTLVGNGAMFFNSFPSVNEGGASRLVSTCFNTSGLVTDTLLLDVSFLQSREYLGDVDSIAVRVSSDFGQTYSAPVAVLYRPNASITDGQWTMQTIDVSSYRNSPSLRLAFDAGGAAGMNIAIDFIRIKTSSVTAIEELMKPSVVAYPNPSNGTFKLQGLAPAMIGSNAVIRSIDGTHVKTAALASEMRLEDLPAGFYVLSAKGVSIKLVITK